MIELAAEYSVSLDERLKERSDDQCTTTHDPTRKSQPSSSEDINAPGYFWIWG